MHLTMGTPRLTDHARQRCTEMGISTKVAKRIVQHPSLVYGQGPPYPPEHHIVKSDTEPRYAVVWDERTDCIVTVIFNAQDFRARNGTTYIPV